MSLEDSVPCPSGEEVGEAMTTSTSTSTTPSQPVENMEEEEVNPLSFSMQLEDASEYCNRVNDIVI